MKEAQSQSQSRVGVSPLMVGAFPIADWPQAAQLLRSARKRLLFPS
jgi:hypothetical protein